MERQSDSTRRSGRVVRRLMAVLMALSVVGLVGVFAAVTWGVSVRNLIAGGAVLSGGGDADACAECHRFRSGFSHPVGVVPSMAVPAVLPLEGGQLTCLTCHDPANHETAAQRHDPLLRAGVGAEHLCGQCHTSNQHSARSMHPIGLGRAHIESKRSAGDSAGLDAESRTCLGCHDGTLAKDVGIGREGSFNSHGATHPVGITYSRRGAAGSGGYGELRPASALDGRIRLFNQQVGCGSCHSPYSSEESLVVINNYRSRLCLSCHQDR